MFITQIILLTTIFVMVLIYNIILMLNFVHFYRAKELFGRIMSCHLFPSPDSDHGSYECDTHCI